MTRRAFNARPYPAPAPALAPRLAPCTDIASAIPGATRAGARIAEASRPEYAPTPPLLPRAPMRDAARSVRRVSLDWATFKSAASRTEAAAAPPPLCAPMRPATRSVTRNSGASFESASSRAEAAPPPLPPRAPMRASSMARQFESTAFGAEAPLPLLPPRDPMRDGMEGPPVTAVVVLVVVGSLRWVGVERAAAAFGAGPPKDGGGMRAARDSRSSRAARSSRRRSPLGIQKWGGNRRQQQVPSQNWRGLSQFS